MPAAVLGAGGREQCFLTRGEEGKEQLAQRFFPLTWELNSPKATFPSTADTGKAGCPLTGEIPLPCSLDDS